MEILESKGSMAVGAAVVHSNASLYGKSVLLSKNVLRSNVRVERPPKAVRSRTRGQALQLARLRYSPSLSLIFAPDPPDVGFGGCTVAAASGALWSPPPATPTTGGRSA